MLNEVLKPSYLIKNKTWGKGRIERNKRTGLLENSTFPTFGKPQVDNVHKCFNDKRGVHRFN